MNQEGNQPLARDGRLYVVFGITLMGVMGVSVITPAFPQISRALGLSTTQVGLLITAFTVPGVVLAPILGFMADRIGRKKILVPALLLFGVAGASCAVARSFPLLLLLRFVQGTGAAPLTGLAITLLGDIYSGNRRGKAVGYNASVLSVGTAAYPAIGGALAVLQWHFPFLLSLLAIPIALVVAFYLKNPEPEPSADSAGERMKAVLSNAWESGILFLSLIGTLVFVILYGAYLTYVPFLLDHRFGASSAVVGAIMSTMSLTTALVSSRHGALATRFSPLLLFVVAFCFYIASLVVFPLIPALPVALVATVLFGIAQGIMIPALQSEIASRAPMKLRGASLSVNTMAIRIGQTVGPILAGAVYGGFGIAGVFFAAAGLAGLLIVMALAGNSTLRVKA